MDEVKQITAKADAAMQNIATESVKETTATEEVQDDSPLAKMKRLVRKAVNCCIE